MYKLMLNNNVLGTFEDLGIAQMTMNMLIREDNIYGEHNDYYIKKVSN